ncbi:AMP-binding protein [Halioxenophilus sp. WMMB6]|uniref:AMP-binding protein n=1 Tax=Halioxenophilus sp. WMMB6 TaxID=3073815 RepID=UPI00295F21F9|nr:AMP-binding protein [Halioxenophilus sp. WMMB6]
MNLEQTIPQIITPACHKFRDKIAFSGLGQLLTYADLDRLSDAFAVYLQKHSGLRPGDRMAVQLPNLLQYPVILFGALKAGLVIVNTNPLYTPREMEHQFNDSGAKLWVVSTLTVAAAPEVIANSCIESVIVTAPMEMGPFLKPASPAPVAADDYPAMGVPSITFSQALSLGINQIPEPVEIKPSDVAMLQYTGGTTGVSKGAMLTHRNLVANTLQVTEHCNAIFREGMEITVCPLPLYHIYAFTVHCMANLSKGSHNILIANPRDIPALVNEIKPYKITGFVGLNTLFNALLHSEEFRSVDLSSLRSTTSGGMALTSETAKAWKELTGIQISEGYGLTEASPTVVSNPPENIHPGTVGRPVPSTEVKTIDGQGNDLPIGEIGELCLRGPQVMLGYWQRPEATAEILSEEGWLRTGDMAEILPDGYVRIVDRKKDMIVVSGFNVYPNEVEDIACQFPGVQECAAIGVPDDVSGEAVKLYVVSKSGELDKDELKKFMRGLLTGYKIPKQVELIASLPKSNVGKVLRRELPRQ